MPAISVTKPVSCWLRVLTLAHNASRKKPQRLALARWKPLPANGSSEILTELKPLTGSGRYIFPSANTGAHPLSDNGVLSALRRMVVLGTLYAKSVQDNIKPELLKRIKAAYEAQSK